MIILIKRNELLAKVKNLISGSFFIKCNKISPELKLRGLVIASVYNPRSVAANWQFYNAQQAKRLRVLEKITVKDYKEIHIYINNHY